MINNDTSPKGPCEITRKCSKKIIPCFCVFWDIRKWHILTSFIIQLLQIYVFQQCHDKLTFSASKNCVLLEWLLMKQKFLPICAENILCSTDTQFQKLKIRLTLYLLVLNTNIGMSFDCFLYIYIHTLASKSLQQTPSSS